MSETLALVDELRDILEDNGTVWDRGVLCSLLERAADALAVLAPRTPPEPPQPGSTLAHIDAIRSVAGDIACITTHDWSEEARALERAADHLCDLVDQLTTAETDIARLNERVEAYRRNFEHAALWVRWIAAEAEDCEVVRAPGDLSRQCAGVVSLVEPIPQPREETPTP